MKDSVIENDRQPRGKRLLSWKIVYRYARRIVTNFFLVAGGVASLLEIYSFGEQHHWLGLRVALSPHSREVIWMLAVGLGGPWAMMLGGIAGAKLAEKFTGGRMLTTLITRVSIKVNMFFALLHCAQMSLDLKIFPRYLSAGGFFEIVANYFLLGLAAGTLCAFVGHTIQRLLAVKAKAHHRGQG